MSLLVGLFLIFIAFCGGFLIAALLSTGAEADRLADAHRRIRSLQAALDDMINRRRDGTSVKRINLDTIFQAASAAERRRMKVVEFRVSPGTRNDILSEWPGHLPAPHPMNTRGFGVPVTVDERLPDGVIVAESRRFDPYDQTIYDKYIKRQETEPRMSNDPLSD